MDENHFTLKKRQHVTNTKLGKRKPVPICFTSTSRWLHLCGRHNWIFYVILHSSAFLHVKHHLHAGESIHRRWILTLYGGNYDFEFSLWKYPFDVWYLDCWWGHSVIKFDEITLDIDYAKIFLIKRFSSD